LSTLFRKHGHETPRNWRESARTDSGPMLNPGGADRVSKDFR
jgi:hypothetical protein